MNEEEHRAITLANERRMQELAERLAVNADALAATMERAADFHEAVARQDGHPLQVGAAAHAAEERQIAADEREEAVRLRRLRGEPTPPPG